MVSRVWRKIRSGLRRRRDQYEIIPEISIDVEHDMERSSKALIKPRGKKGGRGGRGGREERGRFFINHLPCTLLAFD